jgi:hypothetical protein
VLWETTAIDGIRLGDLGASVAIIQKAANLTLEVKVTGGSCVGALNAAGTELVGTYTTQGVSLPLTFRRASGN